MCIYIFISLKAHIRLKAAWSQIHNRLPQYCSQGTNSLDSSQISNLRTWRPWQGQIYETWSVGESDYGRTCWGVYDKLCILTEARTWPQIVPVVAKFLTSCAVWRGRDRRGLIPSIPVPPPSYTRNHVPPQTSPGDEKMRRAALVGLQSHLATFPLSSHFEASFRDQISGEKMGLERGKAQRNQELLKLTILTFLRLGTANKQF